MQAVVATDNGDPSVLESRAVPVPEPEEGEVRIEVERAGVNFADIEKRRGTYPEAPTPPYSPGIEVAGRIDETGASVDRQPGEAVAALVDSGGYAEYAVAPEPRLLDVPRNVALGDAAALPVQFLTAHNALFEWGNLRDGERVLVHAAAGGVGTAAVQLASAAGATVFGTASTDAKLDLAAELGATHTINYETADVVDAIDRHAGGDGVDLVLDGVGGDAFYAGLDALGDCGRIVTYGVASGDIPTVATPRLLFGNKSVRGYHLEHALTHATERVHAGIRGLADRFETGEIRVVIGDERPLADAAEVHRAIEARETTGKQLLVPPGK
jgi:NADPH2:quinone reductase